MKKLIGNIIWLVTFCLMVAVPTYPQVAGIAQSLAWVFIILVSLSFPVVIAVICHTEKKEDLEKWAKKKSWLSTAFAWIKTFAMFAAIAFAGFTVAAGFYLMLSLICRLIRPFAEGRLDNLEKDDK
jgi:Trk-type K+ transport system membrane component